MKTINLFSEVKAEQFGRVWLVNDGQFVYWTTTRAVQQAPKFAAKGDAGYDLWCSSTRSLGYYDHSGIGDRSAKDGFTRESLRWTKKIEAAGGMDYRSLVA